FALFGSYPLADARVILVGDWNQDGRLDFAGATGKNAVEFLVGRGDGTFETALTLPLPNGAVGAAVADLNGDGKPDLVVTSLGLHVFLNTTP
ncbi:MAG: VCBS repeat-containing protein, partial [Myxococcales bacterium]|nr:VCBS repeat-containing protein [Myxococcales bacterium]